MARFPLFQLFQLIWNDCSPSVSTAPPAETPSFQSWLFFQNIRHLGRRKVACFATEISSQLSIIVALLNRCFRNYWTETFESRESNIHSSLVLAAAGVVVVIVSHLRFALFHRFVIVGLNRWCCGPNLTLWSFSCEWAGFHGNNIDSSSLGCIKPLYIAKQTIYPSTNYKTEAP